MKAQNYREELEQVRGDLTRAGFGSFLIIPIKYEPGEVRTAWLRENCVRQPILHDGYQRSCQGQSQFVNNKLGVLAEHQKEVEASTNEAVMGLITLFGIVSILVSLLTIIQILQGGDYWMITIVALLLIVVGAAAVALWRSRE